MDTVVLVIPLSKCKVTKPEKFTESFHPVTPSTIEERISFLNRYKGMKKYVQNPSVQLRQEGKVYPNLSIYERVRGSIYSCDLHVSISLPKAKHGHSFKDVYTEDLDEIVGILLKRLADMGVETTRGALLEAEVNTIHYALNIDFPTIEHARMFLDRMSKVSIGGWFEKHERTYSNDGHAVRFHSSIFQILFYLKYYDLFETKGRSIDRRRTEQEIQIATELKEKGQIPPVIRLEIRMKGKRPVSNHLLAVTGKKQANWSFREVFSTKLSRQVLRYYWEKIIDDEVNRNLLCSFSNEDICRLAIQKTEVTEFDVVLESLGMFFTLQSLGVKDVREFVTLRKSRSKWFRIRRQLVTFLNKYAQLNTELIDLISLAIDNDSDQLEIDLK